jgi:hypothetical protein
VRQKGTYLDIPSGGREKCSIGDALSSPSETFRKHGDWDNHVLVAGLGLFITFAAWGELQTEAFFAMFEALCCGKIEA